MKPSFNKWLLAVVVLLGVFAFSGYGNSPQGAKSPVQTTWVIRSVKPVVNGVQFQALKTGLSNPCDRYQTSLTVIRLSRLRGKTDAVRLKLCGDLGYLNAHKPLNGILKTIPQNDEAEPFPALA